MQKPGPDFSGEGEKSVCSPGKKIKPEGKGTHLSVSSNRLSVGLLSRSKNDVSAPLVCACTGCLFSHQSLHDLSTNSLLSCSGCLSQHQVSKSTGSLFQDARVGLMLHVPSPPFCADVARLSSPPLIPFQHVHKRENTQKHSKWMKCFH